MIRFLSLKEIKKIIYIKHLIILKLVWIKNQIISINIDKIIYKSIIIIMFKHRDKNYALVITGEALM